MILVIMRKIAWFLFIIELHDSLIRLAYMFPFAMITYSVGADVVAVSKTFLEDEEPSC